MHSFEIQMLKVQKIFHALCKMLYIHSITKCLTVYLPQLIVLPAAKS